MKLEKSVCHALLHTGWPTELAPLNLHEDEHGGLYRLPPEFSYSETTGKVVMQVGDFELGDTQTLDVIITDAINLLRPAKVTFVKSAKLLSGLDGT